MSQTISKTLSYWLRHAPEVAGIELDQEGWASVSAVKLALAAAGLNAAHLEATVRESDKQRFELSFDGTQIRARQGHSVKVDLSWPIRPPPEFLFHGTVERFIDAIFAEGLKPMARHHVHLSSEVSTAAQVGSRRGAPVVLRVAAKKMQAEGHTFMLTDNGVWLVNSVPAHFLERV